MTQYGTPRVLTLTGPQVAKIASDAGWKADALITAVAIAYAETAGTLDAHAVGDIDRGAGGTVVPGAQSTGLWQVHFQPGRDDAAGSRYPAYNLDPNNNAKAAYGISKGGTDFGPWSTYARSAKHPNNTGAYAQYLTKARAAVAAISNTPVLTAGTDTMGAPAPIVKPLPASPALATDLTALIVGGQVDMTTDRVSELTLEFADEGYHLLGGGRLLINESFRYEGMAWTVVRRRTRPVSGLPRLVVSAQPSGVVLMRTSTPTGSTNVSPTEYLHHLASAAGLGFVGQPTGLAGAIDPQTIQPESSVGTLPETPQTENGWTLAQRLAQEQIQAGAPFVVYEAGGTVFFGTPQYLAAHARPVELSLNGSTRHETATLSVPLTAHPDCEAVSVETIGNSVIPRGVRIQASVDRAVGKRLRPGAQIKLAGVPYFDSAYRLSRVSWGMFPNDDVRVTADEFPIIGGAVGLSQFIPAPDLPTAEPPPPLAAGLSPQGVQLDRINNADRTRLFGQPGDTVRYKPYKTPWGITVKVHDLVRNHFAAACAVAHARSAWKPKRIDDYNNRDIAKSSSKSLHAWGLAWDFFDTTNPTSIKGPTNAPDKPFRDAFKSVGFYLGAEFVHAESDYPHIEWASIPPPTRPVIDPTDVLLGGLTT